MSRDKLRTAVAALFYAQAIAKGESTWMDPVTCSTFTMDDPRVIKAMVNLADKFVDVLEALDAEGE